MYLDTVELGGPTTTVNQPAAIQTDTWHHLVVSYDSGAAGELKLYVDGSLISEHSEYGGLLDQATSPFTIGLSRPGIAAWGDFEGLIDDVAVWDVALDTRHVSALFGGRSPLWLNGYSQLIGLNLMSDAAGVEESASTYVRVPFTIDRPDTVVSVSLSAHFDDAFVAYINGTEVARSNVTGSPLWNSVASSDRTDAEALRPVEFLIDNQPGLLHTGVNILAIHGLKHDLGDSDFLLLPELDITVQPQPLPEWLELYNSSTSTVDLTGWSLTDGIDFAFAPGTTIAPDSYLVVAQDAGVMTQANPWINVVGPYSGSLGNHDDRIALVDADHNPADDVHYFDGGRWPTFADGGGSSLELRNPFTDNSIAEAWAASDESAKSGWTTHTVRQVSAADVARTTARYNEFIFGLLDSGEFLIDDITVVQDPDGEPTQLIQNGTFESDRIGDAPDTWRLIGNHSGVVVPDPHATNNNALHVTAAGAQAFVHDHAETTFVNNAIIVDGEEYEISFRAKWLGGNSQLNSRLYFNRIPTTAVLDVPQLTGTPGARNSIAQPNIGPTYRVFGHFPVTPSNQEEVIVSVQAQDPDGVAAMTLWWNENGGVWNSVVMQAGNDGHFQGTIPAHASVRVVQFYVEGQDTLGTVSTFPAAGADSRALYQVDNGRGPDTAIDKLRIVMLRADNQSMMSSVNRMSNHFRPTTLVHNDRAFYDVSVRLVGSRWIRPNSGYKVRFHPDNAFYGVHDSIRLDLNGLAEIVMKQMVNRAGGSVSSAYDDIAYLISPNGGHTQEVLLNLARYESIFLDEQFANGANGTKFELDDVTIPTGPLGDLEGLKANTDVITTADIGVNTSTVQLQGDDPEFYRGHLLIKNQRAKDDYASIAALAQAIHKSGNELFEATNQIMDVDLWMRHYAHQSYLGNWDTYGFGRPKNLRIYFRPEDGKAVPLFWDCDLCNFTEPLLRVSESTSRLDEIRDLPANLRLYWGHMLDLIQRSFNEEYVSIWAAHYGALANQRAHGGDESFSSIIQSTRSRSNRALAQIHSAIPEVPFEITTNGGAPLQVDASVVTLEGTGWINVRQLRLAGTNEPLDVQWTNQTTWNVNIPIRFGDNEIVLEAFDYQGQLIGFETVNVSTTANNPVENSLRIVEINYNPYPPTASELSIVATLDNDDFEFVQVENIGTQPINTQRVSFGNGVTFRFADDSLAPGERGIVVRDQSAFELRYGTGLNVLGQFVSGALSNQGERLSLTLSGQTFLDFSYDDDDPWPEGADGSGQSLVLIDPAGTPTQDYGDFERWRGSTEWGGVPDATPASPVGVVINEVRSHTDAPQVDAIELFNTTGSAIAIGGWWLSDDQHDLFKYQIPSGTTISAGGYLVFDESHFNPSPANSGPNDFALSATNGDQVWLIDPNVGGSEPEFFVDNVVFGAASLGETLGRWPNGSGRLDPLTTDTMGLANSAPRVGPLVISEIMFNPPHPGGVADPSQLEFAEIYNPTAQVVDLGDWEFNGLNFTFATGTSLGPGQTMVVVPFDPVRDLSDISLFEAVYGLEIASSLAQYAGPYSGSLDGGGERLTLQRADARPQGSSTISLVVEDRVDYNDTAPWPTSPDGGGDSLHRRLSDLWAGDAASWSNGIPSPGRFGPLVDSPMSPATQVIGEAGMLSGLTEVVQTINLTQAYTNPVVFAQPSSFDGTETVTVRVSNIQSDQFDIQLVEPSNLNGIHGVGGLGEQVSYVILEKGNHVLVNGTRLEVGKVSTGATVGRSLLTPTWETINFTLPFAANPVVISQAQTLAVGGETNISTRQNNISEASFDVAMEPEEINTLPSVTETIGYLAIEPGAGTWNSLPYEAQTSGAQITNNFSTLQFSQTFTTVPGFVGALSSFNGVDNAHLRYQDLNIVGVDLFVEEDTTVDTELMHSAESVDYLAIGGAGPLTALATSLAEGQAETFTINVMESGTVNDVNVKISLQHQRLEDLDVFLEAPDGTLVELLTDVGGNGNYLTGTVLDDGATESITVGAAPFTGPYQPEGLLRDFQGKSLVGTWTLHVTDDTINGDTGTLVGTSLAIELAPVVTGNVTYDSQLDADDIDLLFAALGSADPVYDLDEDGDADDGDVDELVLNIMGKRYGDVDLDQDVDISDFRRLVRHFDPLGTNGFASWRWGNFDGDGNVDIDDFNQLALNFAPLGYPDNLTVPNSVASVDAVEQPASRRTFPSRESVVARPAAESVGVDEVGGTRPFQEDPGTTVWEEFHGVPRRRRVDVQVTGFDD